MTYTIPPHSDVVSIVETFVRGPRADLDMHFITIVVQSQGNPEVELRFIVDKKGRWCPFPPHKTTRQR
jgi:hypothetical protein